MRRAGRKRAFERRDGLLRDRYRGVDGRTIVSSMPGSMVGEPVAKAEPPFRRAEIGGDDARRADRAMYALADEHSPEMLEQLLIALAKQHMSAPMLPVGYADDPRVQPALLRLLEPSRLRRCRISRRAWAWSVARARATSFAHGCRKPSHIHVLLSPIRFSTIRSGAAPEAQHPPNQDANCRRIEIRTEVWRTAPKRSRRRVPNQDGVRRATRCAARPENGPLLKRAIVVWLRSHRRSAPPLL